MTPTERGAVVGATQMIDEQFTDIAKLSDENNRLRRALGFIAAHRIGIEPDSAQATLAANIAAEMQAVARAALTES
jgi:hypothetical protein